MSQALTTSDFLESVFKKAGIDTNDQAVKDLLANKTIETIPADLVEKVNESTYSLEGAKNAPEVFNAVKASTYLKLERQGKKLFQMINPDGDFMEWLQDFRSKNEKSNVVDAYDHMADMLAEKMAEASKGGNGGNPDAGKYAEQLAQMKDALAVKDNDIKALNQAHTEAIGNLQREQMETRINWASREILDGLPIDKTIVKTPEVKAAIYDGILKGAREKFVIKLDENGKPVPFLKENPELRATGGNKEPLTMADIYVEFAKPYLDPSNGKGNEGGNGSANNGTSGKREPFVPETGKKRPSFI